MLVHTSSSPTSRKCDQRSFRAGASRGPIRWWCRAEIARSKVDRLCRKIFDRRKILIERLERYKNRQERSGQRRLENNPLSFFSDNSVYSRQLEFARNSNGLIAPVFEEFDVPFASVNHGKCLGICQAAELHRGAFALRQSARRLRPAPLVLIRVHYPAFAFNPAASMPATAQISSLSEVSPLTPTAPSRTSPLWIKTPPGTGTIRPCASVFTAPMK
jgi:hypothetical protein